MKALLLKLFRCSESAGAPETASVQAPAPSPRKPTGKRKYGKGKPRRPMPNGARKIDPNGPLLEQARQMRGGR
ncbi:hypothetical protein [Pandoraea sp. NPDC087047]|uniref:hypothetical protein n=1 Tax=Pandoraea sp. NPDC087047 TaxID=3364390 RepID=UPI00380D440A